MNLRDLRYVCAVAELRHFGKAAEASHVTQPTLSAQIRKLEDYLGVELFERTNKSVRPTPVGEAVAGLARELLQKADQIEQVARAQKDPEAGPLRLGLIPTIAPYLIPLFVTPLRAALPKIKPVFVEAVTADMLDRLERGDLDAAILATEVEGPRLRAIPLYREPFWLALPRGHRLEHAERIGLDSLDEGEILLLTDGHCFRDQALALCQAKGATGLADTTATSLETIINLVGAGHGITLVPALAIKGAWTTDLGVIVHPLQAPEAVRSVSLVYRAGFPRRALLEKLAAMIRQQVPNTVTPLT